MPGHPAQLPAPGLHALIQGAYGVSRATNQHAWAALRTFLALEQVDQVEEPPELVQHWARLGAVAHSAPKAWMDAYLAAFAIAGGYRLLTFDRDFHQYVSAGLALRVLEGAGLWLIEPLLTSLGRPV